jgi:hypothetical protein
MMFQTKPFYSSSNGDRWLLVPDPTSGQRLVRHEPNRSSGGAVTDIDIEDFLSRDGQGPQHTALRTLLDAEPPMDPAPVSPLPPQ